MSHTINSNAEFCKFISYRPYNTTLTLMDPATSEKEKKRILHTRLLAVTLLLSQLEDEDSDISEDEMPKASSSPKDPPGPSKMTKKVNEIEEKILNSPSPSPRRKIIRKWNRHLAAANSPLLQRVVHTRIASPKKVCMLDLGKEPTKSTKRFFRPAKKEDDEPIWRLQE